MSRELLLRCSRALDDYLTEVASQNEISPCLLRDFYVKLCIPVVAPFPEIEPKTIDSAVCEAHKHPEEIQTAIFEDSALPDDVENWKEGEEECESEQREDDEKQREERHDSSSSSWESEPEPEPSVEAVPMQRM